MEEREGSQVLQKIAIPRRLYYNRMIDRKKE